MVRLKLHHLISKPDGSYFVPLENIVYEVEQLKSLSYV
jgi:hypothetical protein